MGHLDLAEQFAGHLDVARRLHLGQHHGVELLTGAFDDVDQVAVVEGRVGSVDAVDDRLLRAGGPVVLVERADHFAARLGLGAARDGVLEVEEDLVGGERRRLGEELLARAGNRMAGAARTGRALGS